MPVTAEYDSEADALYVRLKDGERANTIEVDDVTYVDVDADGHLLGLELLYPSLGINLEGVASMFGGFQIAQQASMVPTAIAHLAATAGVRTVTLTAEPIMTMSVEGTIAAAHDFATPSVAHADPLIIVGGE